MANYTTYIHFNGETHSVYEWAKIVGLCPTTIHKRVERGCKAGECLSTKRTGHSGNFGTKYTLCWDCANACGGCSWSSREAQPVDGWDATPTKVNMTINHNHPRYVDSYIVHSCPQFVRDAKNGGQTRL